MGATTTTPTRTPLSSRALAKPRLNMKCRKRGRGIGGGGAGKRRRQAESLSPMSPSQLTKLPRGKYMQKEEECVVWDEDTAAGLRRRKS